MQAIEVIQCFFTFTRKRCNSNLKRDVVIQKLAAMVQERNSEHKVNLNHPEVSIVVEVMKNICALSVIKNYFQMSKYNLRQVCGVPVDFDCKKDVLLPGNSSLEGEEENTIEESASEQPKKELHLK